MREIKFRIWNKKKNEWHLRDINLLGETIVLGEILLSEKDEPMKLIDMNDLIVMQFTGLKDKNGKEIYEGDIYQTFIEGNRPIFIVEFINGGFSVAGLLEDIEVIGNIYENPDLLEVK